MILCHRLMQSLWLFLATATQAAARITMAQTAQASSLTGTVAGGFTKDHKLRLGFFAPKVREEADFHLDVRFIHPGSGKSFLVRGVVDSNGSAENKGGRGSIWLVNFTPGETGTWNYYVSFSTGGDIVPKGLHVDGMSGSFDVAPVDGTGRHLKVHGPPTDAPTFVDRTPFPTDSLEPTTAPTVVFGTPFPTVDVGTPFPTVDVGTPFPTDLKDRTPAPTTPQVPTVTPMVTVIPTMSPVATAEPTSVPTTSPVEATMAPTQGTAPTTPPVVATPVPTTPPVAATAEPTIEPSPVPTTGAITTPPPLECSTPCTQTSDCADTANLQGLNPECGSLDCNSGTCRYEAWNDIGSCVDTNFVQCSGDDSLCTKGPVELPFVGTCTGYQNIVCFYHWCPILPDVTTPPITTAPTVATIPEPTTVPAPTIEVVPTSPPVTPEVTIEPTSQATPVPAPTIEVVPTSPPMTPEVTIEPTSQATPVPAPTIEVVPTSPPVTPEVTIEPTSQATPVPAPTIEVVPTSPPVTPEVTMEPTSQATPIPAPTVEVVPTSPPVTPEVTMEPTSQATPVPAPTIEVVPTSPPVTPEVTIEPTSQATPVPAPTIEVVPTSPPVTPEVTMEPTSQATPVPAPTIEVVPTSPPVTPEVTMEPTEEADCSSICAPGEEITLPDVIIEIPAGIVSETVFYTTCALLEAALTESPDLVNELCPLLDSLYSEKCGCAPVGGEPTSAPTVLTVGPDLGDCPICPEGQTMSLPGALILIPPGILSDSGFYTTCGLLELAIIESRPLIEELCPVMSELYADPCGCVGPPTSVPTAQIEEENDCAICPNGQVITNEDAVITIPAGIFSDSVSYATCGLLEIAIEESREIIDPLCPRLPELYADICECKDPLELPPTGPPVAFTEPECTICPEGQSITLPDTVIQIPAGYISDTPEYVTCQLLENALIETPEILQSLCPRLEELYAGPCGCEAIRRREGEILGYEVPDEDETSAAVLQRRFSALRIVAITLSFFFLYEG